MKYFLMSIRDKRQAPKDFGLYYENGKFVNMLDGSIWKICYLYDFGLGDREVGYYREPLPEFEELLKILIESNDKEDRYGAAAIIIYYHIDELYLYLLNLTRDQRFLFIKNTNEFLLFTNLNKFIIPNSNISIDKWNKIIKNT